MRNLRRLAALALLAAFLPLTAFAAGTWWGQVVCEAPEVICAPFGGTVSGVRVRAGDRLEEGQVLCTLQPTRIYAQEAGTVSAVFVQPGDAMEEVKSRYGAAVYLIPEYRFSVTATLKKAAKNGDCYVCPGMTVGLESGRGRTLKTGEGLITAVTAAVPEAEMPVTYTLQVTAGDFYPEEKVTVYRDQEHSKDALLGEGTVEQTAPVAVSAEGSVLRVSVQPGDRVARGDLLFETVTGLLAPGETSNGEIRARTAGIVTGSELKEGAAVEQGNELVTFCPQEAMQVCLTVSEADLSLFSPGKALLLTFSGREERLDGTVAGVSYVAEAVESAGYGNYRVYVDFAADENVRLGMLASVEIP